MTGYKPKSVDDLLPAHLAASRGRSEAARVAEPHAPDFLGNGLPPELAPLVSATVIRDEQLILIITNPAAAIIARFHEPGIIASMQAKGLPVQRVQTRIAAELNKAPQQEHNAASHIMHSPASAAHLRQFAQTLGDENLRLTLQALADAVDDTTNSIDMDVK